MKLGMSAVGKVSIRKFIIGLNRCLEEEYMSLEMTWQ